MRDKEKQEMVRIPLGKRCYLILTFSEYKRAITRGKSERRKIQRKNGWAGNE